MLAVFQASLFLARSDEGWVRSGYELMHRVPNALMQTLWTQHTAKGVPGGAAVDVAISGPLRTALPPMPSLAENGGFTLSVWIDTSESLGSGFGSDEIVQASCDGGGFSLAPPDGLSEPGYALHFSLALNGNLSPGMAASSVSLAATGVCRERLVVPGPHAVSVMVDGGSHVLSMVVDDVLCDGHNGSNDGKADVRGWVYLPPALQPLGGCQLAANDAQLRRVLVFPRYLLTTEAIGMWRAGLTL